MFAIGGNVAARWTGAAGVRFRGESGTSCAVPGAVDAKPVAEFTTGNGWFPERDVDAALGQRKLAVAFQARASP